MEAHTASDETGSLATLEGAEATRRRTGGHVSSRGSIIVDRGGVKPVHGVDAGACAGLGVLELWDGADAVVRPDHGGPVPGHAAGDDLYGAAATVARMVL